MRFAVTFFFACVTALTCVAGSASAQSTSRPKELFDAATGVGLTLPANWNFAVDAVKFAAASDDGKGLVVIVAADKKFQEEVLELEETLGEEVFRDVEVDEAVILMGEKRGALEEVVAVRGSAIHRKDGKPVKFSALLVKSGDKGALVMGAWKDAEHAAVVREILEGIYVKPPKKGGGLELTHKGTGACITLPDKWTVLHRKHGLLAFRTAGKARRHPRQKI